MMEVNMDWKSKYQRSVKDYLLLTERYPMRLEYHEGDMLFNNGASALLLGELAPEEKQSDTALVFISDVTEEEAALLADFVASLRQKQ